ncbi:MAG: Ig-like domain-containing protein [Rhodanobacteraceae bacterium]
MPVRLRQQILLACAMALGSAMGTSARADVGDNSGYSQAYNDWANAELTLLPTSFLPGPYGAVAGLAVTGIDIRLRYLPASFVAPQPAPVLPNSADSCRYSFDLPRTSGDYGNLLNLWDIDALPTDWGALGTPMVGHANTSVKVSVDAPELANWSPSSRTVSFTSGVHHLDWHADTQLDPIFDIALPTVLFVSSPGLKYGKAITESDPGSAKRAFAIGKEFLANAAKAAGIVSASEILNTPTITTASHEQQRDFTVLDVRPPTISTSAANPPPIEATAYGGELWRNHFAELRATINAGDPCGLTPIVGNDAPDLLPIGTTHVTWTARDLGPLGGGNPGVASVQQNIVVQDTLPPILLAPPSRVVEATTAQTPADVRIGNGVVFDLADPEPDIVNTAPTSFPVDSRTEVHWTATDDSGNSTEKSQWITVKTPGTNMPPSVTDAPASTLTGQPVDIVLHGSDSDYLSGRFDPLNFHIVSRPAHGFFVAPLRPYFIEDYRVKPDSEVGDILNYSSNPASDLYDTFCNGSPHRPIPQDFPYRARFVNLRDDDEAYILDEAWYCNSSDAETRRRISMWDAHGGLLNSTTAEWGFSEVNRVTVDSDGGVQAVSPASSSEWLILRRYTPDLSSFQSWELRDKAPLNRTMAHVAAVFDPRTGLIYATDKHYVYVYDGNSGGTQPPFIGALDSGAGFLSNPPSVAGGSRLGFTMEIDSTGALYIPDSGADRIYKFDPSDYDGSTFTPGAMVGWMGKCDTGPNCDDARGRSFGYSCTDATCSVATTSGSGEGQFDTPMGMALDPKDILYVTDYDNYRVQRFSPRGDFAGEAASTCNGSCFVLGDMGRPTDISVNSSKFHVLDRDHSLLHVFETAPFKDISDDSVTVAYASDNDFQGTDTFTFKANDGLVDSNVGTATVQVSRNYRAPEAHDSAETTDEDTPLAFTLDASDPDGIAGVDYNGQDTLTYSVIEQPAHGSLGGSGANLTYTPDHDYNGPDQLRFKVNDGVFDSNIATVSFDVQPVNDVPTVQFTSQNSQFVPASMWPLLKNRIAGTALEAGRGFPFPLMAEYNDPDPGQPHFVQIAWGDGSIQSVNDTTPIDPDADPKPPLLTPAFDGAGQVHASHVYTELGSKTIDVDLLDGAGADSAIQTTVNVIDMVDLAFDVPDQGAPAAPGSDVTLNFSLVNVAPSGGVAGIDATHVVFRGTVPEGVALINASTSQGSCTHADPVTTCTIGTLAPGAEATLAITLRPDPAFNADLNPYQIDASNDLPDASPDNETSVPIPVQQQGLIFQNGFE